MKKFVLQHKGFSSVIIFQVIFILLLIISSVGRSTEIHLDANNLIIKDETIERVSYKPIESMKLNEDSLLVYENESPAHDSKMSLYVTGRNDEETYGRWIIESDALTISPGVYELEATYYSLLYDTEVGGNSDDMSGVVQVLSSANDYNICYNELPLRDGITKNSTRIWVRGVAAITDLKIYVNFYGVGDLRIDEIILRELPMWRFMKILTWIIFFVLIDILYYYIFQKETAKNKGVVAGLVVTVLLTSLPLFVDFLYFGHDLEFHLPRIQALAQSISEGKWIQTIQTDMVNGYGYATPLFYSQFFLYIPAILYALGVPMQLCYQVYVLFIHFLTCLISYVSFKGVTKDKNIALLGTFLYVTAAYRITNVYTRAAVGEYTAMAFYPLLIYGFIMIYTMDEEKISWKEYLAITLGLTGIIQSHILSCEMTAIFIILFCIMHIRKTLQPKRFLSLVMAAFLTLGLNFAFLVPFLDSMSMSTRVNTASVNSVQQYGTYLIQVLGISNNALGQSISGTLGEMPLNIGWALLLGIFLFLSCCSLKREWKVEDDIKIKIGCNGVVLFIVCIILSSEYFPWDSINSINESLAKILCMVQFPWRYLSLATIFAVVITLMGVMIIRSVKGEKMFRVICITIIGASLINMVFYFSDLANSDIAERVYGGADIKEDISSGEYLPSGTIDGDLRWRSVIADLSCISVQNYNSDNGTITFDCQNSSDIQQLVQIPIFNYDHYHAYADNTGEELTISNGVNNRIGVTVPANYSGRIRVSYEVPRIWKISYFVSCFVCIGIVVGIGYQMYGKRKRNYGI